MRKTIFLTVLLLVLILVQPAFAIDDAGAGGALIGEMLDYIYENHLDSPNLDDLVQGAVDGMLGSLKDPYTEYFTKDSLEQFKDSLDGNFVGVGIRLELQDKLIYIEDVISGSPALKAGIKAGDVLVKVDGKNVEGFLLPDIVQMIRGPKGTSVSLTVLRAGEQITYQVNREVVNTPTVTYNLLDKNIGYIVIDTFGSNTAKEFDKAIDALMAEGIKSLVVDLRNNPGGYLDQAVEIAGHFITPGKTVVSIVDRNGQEKVYRSYGKAEAQGMNVAVLVNNHSASASEVLAGALQDYHAAVLVGEKTYGKGVVQNVIPLKEGGALKLTVAKYLTPLGHDLNLVGLHPDLNILTPGLQLAAARQIVNPLVSRVTEFIVGQREVIVNGEKILNEYTPFIDNADQFVPLRFALESLSFQVDWETDAQQVEIKVTGHNIELFIPVGSSKANLNNTEIILHTPVVIKDGVAFVSVKDLKVLKIIVSVNNGKIRLQL